MSQPQDMAGWDMEAWRTLWAKEEGEGGQVLGGRGTGSSVSHGCRGAQALGTEEVAPQWHDSPETSPLFRVWLITPVAWPFLLTQLWLLELLARSGKGALGNSIPSQQRDHRFLWLGRAEDSGDGGGARGGGVPCWAAWQNHEGHHPFLC